MDQSIDQINYRNRLRPLITFPLGISYDPTHGIIFQIRRWILLLIKSIALSRQRSNVVISSVEIPEVFDWIAAPGSRHSSKKPPNISKPLFLKIPSSGLNTKSDFEKNDTPHASSMVNGIPTWRIFWRTTTQKGTITNITKMKVFLYFSKTLTLTHFPEKHCIALKGPMRVSIESRTFPKSEHPSSHFNKVSSLVFQQFEPFDNLDQGSRIDQQIRLLLVER